MQEMLNQAHKDPKLQNRTGYNRNNSLAAPATWDHNPDETLNKSDGGQSMNRSFR